MKRRGQNVFAESVEIESLPQQKVTPQMKKSKATKAVIRAALNKVRRRTPRPSPPPRSHARPSLARSLSSRPRQQRWRRPSTARARRLRVWHAARKLARGRGACTRCGNRRPVISRPHPAAPGHGPSHRAPLPALSPRDTADGCERAFAPPARTGARSLWRDVDRSIAPRSQNFVFNTFDQEEMENFVECEARAAALAARSAARGGGYASS